MTIKTLTFWETIGFQKKWYYHKSLFLNNTCQECMNDGYSTIQHSSIHIQMARASRFELLLIRGVHNPLYHTEISKYSGQKELVEIRFDHDFLSYVSCHKSVSIFSLLISFCK